MILPHSYTFCPAYPRAPNSPYPRGTRCYFVAVTKHNTAESNQLPICLKTTYSKRENKPGQGYPCLGNVTKTTAGFSASNHMTEILPQKSCNIVRLAERSSVSNSVVVCSHINSSPEILREVFPHGRHEKDLRSFFGSVAVMKMDGGRGAAADMAPGSKPGTFPVR